MNGAVIRLDLVGEPRGTAVEQLQLMIFEPIVAYLPDELLADLGAVTFLSATGVEVVVSGLVAAIEHGVWYRVVNVDDQVHRAAGHRHAGVIDRR